jgi:hypothetical protein
MIMKKITLFLVLAVLSALCASAHYYVPRFDPNQDGVSNVADVTDVIDCLLGNANEGINGDMDRNGRVSISDVTLMIDYLLNPDFYDLPQYEPVYPDFEIPQGADVYEVNGVSFAMVPIDTVDEAGNLVHKFSLGVTEVTIELWQAVMGNNPTEATILYDFISPRWPVSNVNWYDANEFIAKLNELTGMEFRLPANYEWGYAARGGLLFHQYRYAGSDDIDEVGWCHSNLPEGFNVAMGGCPVGLKSPNELGLYDMSGNVSEWCCNGPDDGYSNLEAYILGGNVYDEYWQCFLGTSSRDSKDVRQGSFSQANPVIHGLRLAL